MKIIASKVKKPLNKLGRSWGKVGKHHYKKTN
jgi:hypothetical protein